MGFARKSVPRYQGSGTGRDTFCLDSYKTVDAWVGGGGSEASYKAGLRTGTPRVDYRSGCADLPASGQKRVDEMMGD
jgi:hypothetical protein